MIEGKEVMPMADKDSVSKKYLQDKNGSQTCSRSKKKLAEVVYEDPAYRSMSSYASSTWVT